ncbi:MAG: hypothetical protein KDI60_10410 [Xanthomonadales bacterium]|nr:hypothetical protein [Xanthomonadales bacterium]MCB1612152.1 hypothetical protein [Xanthomonadales bacterium]
MQPTPNRLFGKPDGERALAEVCFPHPRIAAMVGASLEACRGGSRGYRRPRDITPKITRTGRVGAGAADDRRGGIHAADQAHRKRRRRRPLFALRAA